MATAPDHPDAEVCGVAWGICPEHGRSLRSSRTATSCTAFGCDRTWDYDRLNTACPEQVWAELVFPDGETKRFCEAHARDAEMHVRPDPPAIRRLDGVPFEGAPYDEGAQDSPPSPRSSADSSSVRPDTEPYACAVVDALSAADIIVNRCTATGKTPNIYLELDLDQCRSAGFSTRVVLEWNSISGWRYGPEDGERPEAFLWALSFGGRLLPTPAEIVDFLNRAIFHVDWLEEPEPQYRDHDADDDLAGQLDRAARGDDGTDVQDQSG